MQFATMCLAFAPEDRIMSKEAVNHNLFLMQQTQHKTIQPVTVTNIFNNICEYQPEFLFQQHTLRLMVHRFVNAREANSIKIIFNALDTEKDGELLYEEFSSNMKATFGLSLVDKDFRRILKNADLSGDGIIQFTEFLMAGCNKYDLLTDSSMRTAFSNMDYDKDGKITTADYDFMIRGFLQDTGVPFEETEHGRDWAKMTE